MAWLIIILIIAMVVGPVMWLKPNAQQRRQISLRQKAAALGLRVDLQAPPQTSAAEVAGWVAYRLPAVKANSVSKVSNYWCLKRSAYEHELNFCGFWRWLDDKAARLNSVELKEILATLPENISCLAWDRGGAVVYWRENRDEVALIKQSLEAVQKVMIGK